MYYIEIPDTINRITASLYLLGFWESTNATTFFKRMFHIVYSVSFLILVFVGICTTKDKDEIALAVLANIILVNIFKMCHIILHEKQIVTFIDQAGNQSTNDQKEFIHISNKLKLFNRFVKCFIWMCAICVVFIAILPIFSQKKVLAFSVGFPEWKNNAISFWMTHALIVGGSVYSLIFFLSTIIIWYLMMNFAIKYEMLGNQLRKLNDTKPETLKVSEAVQEKIFLQQLISAIKTHRAIIEY